ncbi:MAG: hypothetical protein Q7R85_02965 [bacterium]|nr:hypothetical protein [bacterium]
MAVALERFPEAVSKADRKFIWDLVDCATAKILPAIESGEKQIRVACVEMSEVARPTGNRQWLRCKAGWLRGQASLMWEEVKSMCDGMEQFLKSRGARGEGGAIVKIGKGVFRRADLTGLVLYPALEPVIPPGAKDTWCPDFRPDGYRIVIKISL